MADFPRGTSAGRPGRPSPIRTGQHGTGGFGGALLPGDLGRRAPRDPARELDEVRARGLAAPGAAPHPPPRGRRGVAGRGPADAAQRAEHRGGRSDEDQVPQRLVLERRRLPGARRRLAPAAPARAGRGRHRRRGPLPAGVRDPVPRGHRRQGRVPVDGAGVQHVPRPGLLLGGPRPAHRQRRDPGVGHRRRRQRARAHPRPGPALGELLPVPERHRPPQARGRPLLGEGPRARRAPVAPLRLRRRPGRHRPRHRDGRPAVRGGRLPAGRHRTRPCTACRS